MNNFADKKIMITGGLGFIGSNLAIKLVELGCKDIILIDSLVPEYGGNWFNIAPIKDKVRINIADVRDTASMNQLVRDRDYIFNLAGTLSHIDSLTDPFTDLEINGRSQISILEACRKFNSNAKILFTGTRGQYGVVPPEKLPVTEDYSTLFPADPNGVNKNLGEQYHLLYNRIHGMKTVCLRLTNIFGPRHQMKNYKQGFLAWFVRLALEGKDITVYEPGTQKRDFNYVSDVVDALLRSMVSEKSNGQVYNIGSQQPISVFEVAQKVVQFANSGKAVLVPYPPEKKKIEIGDYSASYKKINQELGWEPKISFDEGMKQMIEYYRKYKNYYW